MRTGKLLFPAGSNCLSLGCPALGAHCVHRSRIDRRRCSKGRELGTLAREAVKQPPAEKMTRTRFDVVAQSARITPNRRGEQLCRKGTCALLLRAPAARRTNSLGISAQRPLFASRNRPTNRGVPSWPRTTGRQPWPATRRLTSSARWISWSTGEKATATGRKPVRPRVGQCGRETRRWAGPWATAAAPQDCQDVGFRARRPRWPAGFLPRRHRCCLLASGLLLWRCMVWLPEC